MKLILTLFVFFTCISNSFCQPSATQLARLTSFAKLYGYVKYFHPSDEAAELDWDAFAVYGIKRILDKDKDENFHSLLEELFNPIAPTIKICSYQDCNENKSRFDLSLSDNNLKTVLWQHLGNGNFNSNYTYKSVRTNRKRNLFPSGYYSETFKISLETGKVKAEKRYKVRFRIKNINHDSYYLVNIKACWNDSNNRSVCTSIGNIKNVYWKYFNKEIVVGENAKFIHLMLETRGSGESLLDDITLEDLETSEIVCQVDFDNSEDVNLVVNTKKESLFETQLKNFPGKSGAVISLYPIIRQKNDTLLFETALKFGDKIDTKLFDNIHASIPLVLLCNEASTLPRANPVKHKYLINVLNQIKNDFYIHDKARQLADIVVLWNEIQHFYPYLTDLKIDWQSILVESIKMSQQADDFSEHSTIVRWMLAHLEDSHVFVASPYDRKTYRIPYKFDFAEGKIFVSQIFEGKNQPQLGDQLMAIDNHEAEDLLVSKRKYISSGVEEILNKRALEELFSFKKNQKLTLKLKNNEGKIYEIVTSARFSQSQITSLEIQQKAEGFNTRRLDKELIYLNFMNISSEIFNLCLPQLKRAHAIVIDLRGYPTESGDGMRAILSHFINIQEKSNWMFYPTVDKPNRVEMFENSVSRTWDLDRNTPNFSTKPIFVLVNHQAQSYSESIIGYFDQMENVTLVGTPTAGANGSVNLTDLPTGIYFRYTGMKVLKHDGSRLHGIGFLPDVEVRPTIQGIIEGRDEVLEKAIELAKKNVGN